MIFTVTLKRKGQQLGPYYTTDKAEAASVLQYWEQLTGHEGTVKVEEKYAPFPRTKLPVRITLPQEASNA